MTEYNCYTDASTLKHLPNPTSGIAAVVVNLDYNRLEKTTAQYLRSDNNIYAEVRAVNLGISTSSGFLCEDDLLRICTDCQPAIDLITTDSEVSSDRMSRVLDRIDKIIDRLPCDIQFQWVKGHSNHPVNDFADSLAYTHAQGHPYDD